MHTVFAYEVAASIFMGAHKPSLWDNNVCRSLQATLSEIRYEIRF